MRNAARGRATRHDDEVHEDTMRVRRAGAPRPEAPHLRLRSQPRPLG